MLIINIYLSILYLIYRVEYAQCDCTLSVKKDFGSPAPVFVQNGAFLAPNDRGVISLQASQAIRVACPGNKNSIVLKSARDSAKVEHQQVGTNNAVLDAQCVAGSSFHLAGYTALMKDITCSIQPWLHLEDTRVACHTASTIYKAGFMVGNDFYKLYEACYNSGRLSTVFVKHTMAPSSTITQPGRPSNFIEGDLFRNTEIATLYNSKDNIKRLNVVLGPDLAKNYIDSNQYLTKGHLAPQCDFPLFAQKRVSFHYINVAPQWESSNNGEWKSLENDLKAQVKRLGTTLTVYTGTHGVMELPDHSGQMTPIYLGVDSHNNNLLPVPKYFYKLVYNPNDKTATAFITINSAFYTKAQRIALRFCHDICSVGAKYKWLSWQPTADSNFFCCTYEDFVKEVPYLATLDVAAPKKSQDSVRKTVKRTG